MSICNCRLEITDCETRKVYSAPVNLVHESGFRFNRGHGTQVALGMEYWSVNGQPSEHDRNQAIQQAKQAQAGQLALFGEAG